MQQTGKFDVYFLDIYASDGSNLTHNGHVPRSDQVVVTPPLRGDSVLIEVNIPHASLKSEENLVILSQVIHSHTNILGGSKDKGVFASSPTAVCENNVKCATDYEKEKRAG